VADATINDYYYYRLKVHTATDEKHVGKLQQQPFWVIISKASSMVTDFSKVASIITPSKSWTVLTKNNNK